IDRAVAEKSMEETDGVRTSAHARDERVGKLSRPLEDLRARLASDDRLELAHEPRVRMRADGGSEEVVRGLGIGDPGAERLVDGRAQRPVPRGDGNDLRAEPAHAIDV